MALTYSNQFVKAGSFQIQATAPIDNRMVVDSKEDLLSAFGDFAYEGQVVAIKGTKDLYILVAPDNTVAENWKKIGGGAELALTYSDAVALATSENLGTIMYVSSAETIGEGDDAQEYSAGAYIVTGEGTLAKLGTTTASGDLASDVTVLQGQLADTKKDVSDIQDILHGTEGTPETITNPASIQFITGEDGTQIENPDYDPEAPAEIANPDYVPASDGLIKRVTDLEDVICDGVEVSTSVKDATGFITLDVTAKENNKLSVGINVVYGTYTADEVVDGIATVAQMESIITENEKVTAEALSALNQKIESNEANMVAITDDEIAAIFARLTASAEEIPEP